MKVLDKVNYDDYLELKYQLTSDLKILTDNVNKLTISTEKRLDSLDKKMEDINIREITRDAGPLESNSHSTLIYIVLSIAFIGSLGAAIGINLLKYLPQ